MPVNSYVSANKKKGGTSGNWCVFRKKKVIQTVKDIRCRSIQIVNES